MIFRDFSDLVTAASHGSPISYILCMATRLGYNASPPLFFSPRHHYIRTLTTHAHTRYYTAFGFIATARPLIAVTYAGHFFIGYTPPFTSAQHRHYCFWLRLWRSLLKRNKSIMATLAAYGSWKVFIFSFAAVWQLPRAARRSSSLSHAFDFADKTRDWCVGLWRYIYYFPYKI